MTDQVSRTGARFQADVSGVLVAFAFGFLTIPVGLALLPRQEWLFVLIGLGGLVGTVACVAWWGGVANAAGFIAYLAWQAAATGFSGFHLVALALILPLVAVGTACGTIVNRVRARGLASAIAERGVRVAAALALVVVVAWIAGYAALMSSDSLP